MFCSFVLMVFHEEKYSLLIPKWSPLTSKFSQVTRRGSHTHAPGEVFCFFSSPSYHIRQGSHKALSDIPNVSETAHTASCAPSPFWDEVWRAQSARHTSSFPLGWRGTTRSCRVESIRHGLTVHPHIIRWPDASSLLQSDAVRIGFILTACPEISPAEKAQGFGSASRKRRSHPFVLVATSDVLAFSS